MSTLTASYSRSFVETTRPIETLRSFEPRFFALGALMLAAALPTAFASLVDGRQFQGIDVWVKPFKFEMALVVYTWTLAFFARFLPAGTTARRWYRFYVGAVAAAIILEMIWIGGAAALATASHFNPTPFGDLIYSAMGFAAVFLTSASAVYAVLIARNPSTGLSPALKDAVVIGLALVLPLTLVTAGTMAAMGSTVGGSGSVPVACSAKAGRGGGDLRGALQCDPGVRPARPASVRKSRGWLSRQFVGFDIFLFAQALRGEPFLPWLG